MPGLYHLYPLLLMLLLREIEEKYELQLVSSFRVQTHGLGPLPVHTTGRHTAGFALACQSHPERKLLALPTVKATMATTLWEKPLRIQVTTSVGCTAWVRKYFHHASHRGSGLIWYWNTVQPLLVQAHTRPIPTPLVAIAHIKHSLVVWTH